LIFINFQKAFDNVNRQDLIMILEKRIKCKETLRILQKLLLPIRVYLDDRIYFTQNNGTPQGMACSPLLFNTYLDHYLNVTQLKAHKIKAYAHDIVITASSQQEVAEIL
jgi:retron-type reverse transcriptase